MKNWELVTTQKCELGEGPVWSDATRCILWTDVTGCRLHSFCVDMNKHFSFSTDFMVGSFALRKSGGLIAATERGFAVIHPAKERVEYLTDPESHIVGNRFNDGKCDPAGRFWAGTMSTNNEKEKGSLYTLNADLTVAVKLNNVSCSNGMAWSTDHKTFYYVDTPTQEVVAFDYNILDGAIDNRRVVIRIPAEEGYPDGMTIDEEGMLWIAIWNGWKVMRWNPNNGKFLSSVSLPVSKVSSCIFGGKNLDDLYITSARGGLTQKESAEQSLAGSLFVIKNTGYKGVKAVSFGE